jgi:hypothetical protein
MPVSWFGSGSFNASHFEPKVRQEAVLKDVVHCIVAVPAANNEHEIFANDRRMAEAIQRQSPLRLNPSPLVLMIAEFKLVKVVVTRFAIVATKNIHAAFPEHRCVVCPWCWLLRALLQFILANDSPFLFVDVKVKQVVKVGTLFPLIPSEKVQSVHVSNASCA